MPVTRRSGGPSASDVGKVTNQNAKREGESEENLGAGPPGKRARKQASKTTSKKLKKESEDKGVIELDDTEISVSKKANGVNDKRQKLANKSAETKLARSRSRATKTETQTIENVKTVKQVKSASDKFKTPSDGVDADVVELDDAEVSVIKKANNKRQKLPKKPAEAKLSRATKTEQTKTNAKTAKQVKSASDKNKKPSDGADADQEGPSAKVNQVTDEVKSIKTESNDSLEPDVILDDSDSDFEDVPEPKIKVTKGSAKAVCATVKETQSDQKIKKEAGKLSMPAKGSPAKGKVSNVALDDISPMDLLLKLESERVKNESPGTNLTKGKIKQKPKKPKMDAEEMSDSGSDSDWENVADINLEKDIKDQVPDKAVEITLQEPNLFRRKRKRKRFDLEDWFQKQVNKYQRERHLEMHKVHLLCLLSFGFQRNDSCNDPVLQSLALSQVPLQDFGKPVKNWDANYLTKITKWFSKFYSIDAETEETNTDLMKMLPSRFESKKVSSEDELVHMFVLTIRSLGGEVRLVMSFQPLSHKPDLKNFKIKRRKREPEENEQDDKDDSSVKPSSNSGSLADSAGPSTTSLSKKSDTPTNTDSVNKEKPASSKKEVTPSAGSGDAEKETTSNSSKNGSSSKGKTTKGSVKKGSGGKKSTARKTKKDTSPSRGESASDNKERSRKSRRSSSGKKSYKETFSDVEDSDEDNFEPKLSESSSEDEEQSSAKKKSKGKGKKSKQKSPPATSEDVVELSSGSDFEEMETTFRSPTATKPKRRNKKILSSESDDSVQLVKEKIKSKGTDYWAEVYLEKEKKWMCVDCLRAEINKPHDLENRATKPVSYIVAFDKGNHVKDVTRRYASSFSNTRKNRPDTDWWEETLELYSVPETEKDSNEDMQLQAELMQKPLPTVVGEYKNHPLYALQRHLLKFEAFYPEGAVPVGYIRGEAVFSRECVHTLHTRENWMKEARVVRIGEPPYKLVKGRKKRRQALAGGDVEPVAELFGQWQTEDYIPPPAVDGKVPKNEYGNIEMFRESMLPGGTVHLKGLNGLNRVARKLNIDVAAAMVGWDHHCGFAHPVLDGWVVCEEHKDILLAAWDEEQEIIREREAQKRDKRIYGNWKLLIKGVLIREKLKSRFNLQPADETKEESPTPGTSTQKAGDMEISWPQNRQKEKEKQKSKSKKKKDEGGPLFPFEEI